MTDKTTKDTAFTFRLTPGQLALIKQEAERRGMSASRYVTDAALGRLDVSDQRAGEIEERLALLEAATFNA